MEDINKSASEIVGIFDPTPDIGKIPYCETGEVISPLPDLKIKVRDNIYIKQQIKLDEYWTKGHKREIEIPSATLTGSDTNGDEHISGGFPLAYIIFKDELVVGDLVTVIPSRDKQTLYVLNRIARW